MSNTPLLTVRCPQEIAEKISAVMNATGQNKTQVVVELLRNTVPSLPIMERAKLPKIPAIYLVITPSNKLLYIGRATNLFESWLKHESYQQFIEADPNTRVVWFHFDESDRDSLPVIEEELLTLSNSEYKEAQVIRDKAVAEGLASEINKLKEAIANLPQNPKFISAVKKQIAVSKRSMKTKSTDVGETGGLEKLPDEGLSDYQLSKIVGLSRSAITRYRTGSRSKGKDRERVMREWEVRDNRWFRRR